MSTPFRPRSSSTAADLTDLLNSSFLDKDIHSTIKIFLKQCTEKGSKINQAIISSFMNIVLYFIETGNLNLNSSSSWKDKLLTESDSLTIFISLLTLISSAIRNHVKDQTFTNDLVKIGFPSSIASEIVSQYSVKRDILNQVIEKQKATLPTISNMSWRVDVTISTTSLARVFKPSLLVQLALSPPSNRVVSFEVSVERFQRLRYEVAKALKMVQDLEAHPQLRKDD